MYKIMIVDDETYFREYLKSAIDWNNLEFSICSEASNGKDALKKMQAELPDIVLADINMPHFDGISFAEQAIKMYPDIKIIFITGYNEFKYAKSALKLGVADYILKPFEKKELTISLNAVKRELKERKTNDAYIRNLETRVNDSIEVLKNNILFDAVKGDYKNKHGVLKRKLQSFGLVFPEGRYLVASLNINVSTKMLEDSESNYRNKLIEVLSDTLRDNSIFFEGKNNQFVIITSLDEDNGYRKCLVQFNKIIAMLASTIADGAVIGVGTQKTNIKYLDESYKCSQAALKNQFILGSNKVIEYDALKIDDEEKEALPFNLKNVLFMNLRLLNEQKVNETLREIYKIFKERKLSIDYIYAYYNELITLCLSYISEYGYTGSDIFGDDFNPFGEMQMKPTLKDLHEYIFELYNKLIKTLYDRKKNYTIEVVEKAKKYIDDNYANHNLRLEDIAFNVFVHESYLRLLYKKHMGITIGQYLTKKRMQQAKYLLENNYINYADIAQKTGYSDAAYFSKCFKKYYKVSPSEYRKSINLKKS